MRGIGQTLQINNKQQQQPALPLDNNSQLQQKHGPAAMMGTVEHTASFIKPENGIPERPGTPERPPYSPVTPVLSHLAPIPGGAAIIPPGPELSQPQTPWNNNTAETPEYDGIFRQDPFARPPPMPVKPEPAAVPISESDNPDVIALRSAISVLQLQKQKALKDIKTLDEMKKAAMADPKGFAQELVAGRLSQDRAGLVDTHLPPDDDDEKEDDVEAQSPEGKFGKIPNPQNVVRMPPINWAKYQIVGEPLDRIHDEQRTRPVAGEPRQSPNERAPEHFIATPYRPLTDKLESPTKARAAKREKKG